MGVKFQSFEMLEAIAWRLFTTVFYHILGFAITKFTNHPTISVALYPMKGIIRGSSSRLMGNNHSKKLVRDLIIIIESTEHPDETH